MTETADTKQAKQEIERAAAPKEKRTALEVIEALKPEIERSLQSKGAAEILTRHVYTAYRYSPELQMCSAESLVGALLLSAQVRLEPGPLGHVYLVPYRRQGVHEIVWMLGYTGIIELGRRGGATGLSATVVWDCDLYERPWQDQKGWHWKHVPGAPEQRTERVAVLVTWREGTERVALDVPDSEIDRALAASPRKDKSRRAEDWYWRKTGVRRARPWLPLTAELARADEADEHVVRAVESVDLGFDAPVAEAILEEAEQ